MQISDDGAAADLKAMDRSVVALLRHFTKNAPGAFLYEDDEVLMAAAHVDYLGPMHNALFCKSPPSEASQVIRRANAFFGRMDRHYVLWIGTHEHDDLEATARACGLQTLGSPQGAAAMALRPNARLRAADARQAAPDRSVTLAPISSPQGARRFVDVVSAAFAARERPQPRSATEALFRAKRVLMGDDVVAYLATMDGSPVAAAMVHIDDGTANICWVSTVPSARGNGLAALVTQACVDAASRAGAERVVLQSSTMGEPVYQKMGFTEITRYRRLCHPEGLT